MANGRKSKHQLPRFKTKNFQFECKETQKPASLKTYQLSEKRPMGRPTEHRAALLMSGKPEFKTHSKERVCYLLMNLPRTYASQGP